MFFRDLDTGKAILIYGAALLESGENLLKLGRKDEGVRALDLAGRITPQAGQQALQILRTYGVR